MVNPIASSVLSVALGGTRLPIAGRSAAFTASAGSASPNRPQSDPRAAAIEGLFSEFGAQQKVVGESRRLIERVRNALTDLRATLQEARAQRTGGSPQLTLTTREGETRQALYDRRAGADPVAYQTEGIYETRNVYESRQVYAMRDIVHERTVYETKNIYETQPVYEDQAIYKSVVTGTRNLSSYSKLSDASIQVGSDFSVQVGSGPLTVVKFTKQNEITVTLSGVTQTFAFASSGGSWRQGLTDALNSVAGLDASITAGGRLELKTEAAQSLSIADVANGVLDFTGSPLGHLGLTAGTTQPTITGYQSVQVGTEQVLVGTEQVTVGTVHHLETQQVEIGTEQVVVGGERVKVETQDRLVSRSPVSDATINEQVETLRAALTAASETAAAYTDANPAGDRSDKASLASETADLLRDLGLESLSDVWSSASIERSLSRVEGALTRSNELQEKYAKATSRQDMADRIGILLQSALNRPASNVDALTIARQAAQQLRDTTQPIGKEPSHFSMLA
jgi:hypothetical protein